MAKLSKIVNNNKRKKLSANKIAQRIELRNKVKNVNLPEEERYEAILKLQSLPRNSSETRVRNRCEITGRPRAFYRKFKLSRITFRELALRGMIPGVTKSSW